MNQTSEEQKIRQWFHEARQADAARAPAFADVLAALPKRRREVGWLAWRIAFVSVALIAISVAAFVFFKQSAAQTDQQIAGQFQPLELRPIPIPPAPVIRRGVPPLMIKPRAGALPARGRRLRAANPRLAVEPSALLSFKWQSPTDFLLRTPGADLLKSVPRVTDSVIRFGVIRPDARN